MMLRVVFACLCLLSPFCLPAGGGKAPRILVGFCARLNEIEAARAAGFDYVELRTSEIAELADADYEKLVDRVKRLGIRVPVTFLFIPGSIKLTGPNIDKQKQMDYVRKALARVSRLGAHIVVFGSGQARRVPEGFSKEEAFLQLVDFCKRIAPEAKARKITIAIEPQRRQECNIINTAAEALELITAVDHPNIQLVIDFYHLSVEKERELIILKARDHIRHLHMANPNGRVFPLNREEYEYAPFFDNLRRIEYEGLISVEAQSVDFAKEAPQTIAFLREALGIQAR